MLGDDRGDRADVLVVAERVRGPALMAFAGLTKMGYGMDWRRTLHATWLALRAIQLWAPLPDNNPGGARARMRRFYALVRLSYGEPASPAKAAELEIDWWRVHRQVQYSVPGVAREDLVESVTRLYCYLFGEPEPAISRRRCAGSRRWACPISGSGRAAGPTARSCRWRTPRWSAATPRCSPPYTTEQHQTDASPTCPGEHSE